MKTRVIGLTGGIGSGKSTVAKQFAALGVPIYMADEAAREVMQQPEIIAAIKAAFGDVMDHGTINRQMLAKIVFNDPAKLLQLNNIVHPAVKQHFKEWLLLQDCPFVIREAAILFESGSYVDCDAIITVTAPLEDRISRVIKRDDISRAQVLQRIENQWTDDMRISKSDFVISNTDLISTKKQVTDLFAKLHNQ